MAQTVLKKGEHFSIKTKKLKIACQIFCSGKTFLSGQIIFFLAQAHAQAHSWQARAQGTCLSGICLSMCSSKYPGKCSSTCLITCMGTCLRTCPRTGTPTLIGGNNVNKFCTMSNSTTWNNWLYHFYVHNWNYLWDHKVHICLQILIRLKLIDWH